jgi:hypothetical protein
MWRLDDNEIATFNQAAEVPNHRGLRIVTVDQIPLSMRKHLVALN